MTTRTPSKKEITTNRCIGCGTDEYLYKFDSGIILCDQCRKETTPMSKCVLDALEACVERLENDLPNQIPGSAPQFRHGYRAALQDFQRFFAIRLSDR